MCRAWNQSFAPAQAFSVQLDSDTWFLPPDSTAERVTDTLPGIDYQHCLQMYHSVAETALQEAYGETRSPLCRFGCEFYTLPLALIVSWTAPGVMIPGFNKPPYPG